jgi:ABC-2 type transport system permease protein
MTARIWPILRSELVATLRRPLLVLCAAVFFLLAFQTISITSPTASGVIRIGRLWHNSPYIVAKLTAVLSVVGLFVAALLIAPTVQRDFQHRAHPFFLSLPITRADYLLGRFTGAFGATLLVFAGGMAGVLAAAVFIPSDFTGPHRLIAFLQPLLLFAVPNLLLAGAICFAVATLSRSMVGVYISTVVLMMVLGIGQSIVDEALQKGLMNGPWSYVGAFAEPFGAAALQIATAAWSPAEKNLRAIPMAGLLLVHRLFWSGVAVGLLAFTCRRFRRVENQSRSGGLQAAAGGLKPAAPPALRAGVLSYARRQVLRQYTVLTLRELRLTVSHLAFIVLALATVANLSSNFLGNVRGQHVYPRTGFFLEHALNDSAIVIVLTVFFAGVLVWRERGHRTHEILDSQPLPNAVLYGSKLSALLLMQVAYAVLVIGYGIFVQLALYRYTHLELDVYLAAVFGVKLLGWWAIAVVVLLLQAAAPNMYAGYAMSAVVIGAGSIVPLGRAGGLFRAGFAPPYVYSDMNGFGHFGPALLWYRTYWALVSVCLVIVAALLWPRGTTDGVMRRLRTLPARMTPRVGAILAAALMAATAGATVILLNGAPSESRLEALRATYEQKYRRFDRTPQPWVEAVDLSADFLPRQRRLHLRGTMTLRNATAVPIGSLHVTLLPTRLAAPARLELDGPVSRTLHDAEHGYTIFTLAAPLAPGSTTTLRYDYALAARGFSEDGHLVRNGSVIVGNDPQYFPQVGYQSKLELSDRSARLRHGLTPIAGAEESDVPRWMTFHAIVSTDAEQQPIASGHRLREWTSGDRRNAEFTTDGVVGRLFMLGSGEYARANERIGPVDVEILYHADHPYNLRSMFAGLKCGLESSSRHFAPYPYRSLRIVELPPYTMSGNAQALSTVILWSERGGFITDVARDAGVDRVYSTAAHEAAHQWWGNSVPVLNEVLSDYARVGCLERAFGQERTVELLRDMRWMYFRGRDLARDSGRPEAERPLRDGGQYNSGYILMWRLRRVLGEDVVNGALRDVVAEFGYRSDRIPVPRDVAEAIKRHAPEELHPLIADTFDRITLHPIRAREARAIKLSDGRYRVTLSADLRKTYSDRDELAVPAPLDGYADWIDVGVYGEDGRVLSLATHRIADPRRDLSIVVDAPPSRVVLDPLCTLLDSDSSDNEVTVSGLTRNAR